ncbi:hypothetical protein BJP32_06230 [Brevundimonas sp. ZS04]|nr:hypothetical protein BJP32_06230 [Brevundimonas sp. ZS04]
MLHLVEIEFGYPPLAERVFHRQKRCISGMAILPTLVASVGCQSCQGSRHDAEIEGRHKSFIVCGGHIGEDD